VPTGKSRNTATTRHARGVLLQGLFHFQDDVVIHIRPRPDGRAGIAMRSKSRYVDRLFCAFNAKRIRRFFRRVAMFPRQKSRHRLPRKISGTIGALLLSARIVRSTAALLIFIDRF